MRATIEALGTEERGRYLTALTFGNVHGVYHPDSVHLRPEILEEIQTVVGGETGRVKPFDLVLHGRSRRSTGTTVSSATPTPRSKRVAARWSSRSVRTRVPNCGSRREVLLRPVLAFGEACGSGHATSGIGSVELAARRMWCRVVTGCAGGVGNSIDHLEQSLVCSRWQRLAAERTVQGVVVQAVADQLHRAGDIEVA
jgi:Fructose-bisphosphate aldolase class-II